MKKLLQAERAPLKRLSINLQNTIHQLCRAQLFTAVVPLIMETANGFIKDCISGWLSRALKLTPAAVATAIENAAKMVYYSKGGIHLEAAGHLLKKIAFDKQNITKGIPAKWYYVNSYGRNENELITT